MAFLEARGSVRRVLGQVWLLVRWALVPVASSIGFYMCLLAGAYLHGFVRDWCPWGDSELVAAIRRGESVECPVPLWVEAALRSLFSTFAAIAVVSFGTFASPIRRRWVPWVIYAVGATAAAHMTLTIVSSRLAWATVLGGLHPQVLATVVIPSLCTFATGAATAAFLARRLRSELSARPA